MNPFKTSNNAMSDIQQNNLKTSSKRIAEKTGKQHSHVIRDIINMLDELRVDDPKLDDSEYQIIMDRRNYVSEININERLSICLASGYSIKLRMAIIDDWAEMKASTKVELPSYPEALRQLAEKIEETERMQQQLEAQKTAVDFYQAVTDSTDAISIGDAAKVLNMGIGRTKLFQFLRDSKILTKRNIPYQEYIDRGYFRIIEQKFNKPDGSTHINIKTVVYQKGLDHIRKEIEKFYKKI